jgi:hypothetical protein
MPQARTQPVGTGAVGSGVSPSTCTTSRRTPAPAM